MSNYNWNSLEALLRPKGIAIVGASADESKYPGKVVKNLSRSGFPGKVFPINPKYDEIFGYKAYAGVGDLPEPADVALLLVGAHKIPALLDELAAAGTKSVIVYASGMAEASESGRQLQDEITAKVKATGMRMLGPNCLGCIDREYGSWLSGAAVLGRETLLAGPLAMVTQSGGIMGSFLDRAMAHGIGFTKAIATGNEADINVADCIGYFAQDDSSRAIAVFAESVRDVPRFSAACRLAADRGKPVVMLKTGRSERGKRVTQGHTAALIGDDAAYEALFDALGVIRVHDLDDLFLIPHAIVSTPRPKGTAIAVISASGGLAGLAADECDRLQLNMAEFSPATQERVRELQAGYGGCYNPLDITGQVVASDKWWQVRHMHELLLNDPGVDLVVSGQAAGQYADQTGIDLVEMATAAEKPLLPFWTGRDVNALGLRRLREASLPVFEQASAGLRAAAAVVRHAEFQRARTAPDERPSPPDPKRAAALREAIKAGGADERLAELYNLPRAVAKATFSMDGAVGIRLVRDNQVGAYLSLRACDGTVLNVLPPQGAEGARALAERFCRPVFAEPCCGRIIAILADALKGLWEFARESDLPVAAQLTFDTDSGAVLDASYRVLRDSPSD